MLDRKALYLFKSFASEHPYLHIGKTSRSYILDCLRESCCLRFAADKTATDNDCDSSGQRTRV